MKTLFIIMWLSIATLAVTLTTQLGVVVYTDNILSTESIMNVLFKIEFWAVVSLVLSIGLAMAKDISDGKL